MKKEININTCLANDIRWKMIEIAGVVSKEKERFKFKDIVNDTNFSKDVLENHNRRLREHFLEIIKVGLFTKIEKTYFYSLNNSLLLSHSKIIESLAI